MGRPQVTARPPQPAVVAGSDADHVFREEALTVVFMVLVTLLVQDATYNALGHTNGKFVSLLDTVDSLVNLRAGMTYSCNLKEAFLLSFLAKFFTQTIVSSILGTTPVLLKGPRHLISFCVGFALIWLSPGDSVYQHTTKSHAVKLLMRSGSGLYKLRKALFAVEQSRSAPLLAVVVVALSIDGNSYFRRCVLWLRGGCKRFSFQETLTSILASTASISLVAAILLWGDSGDVRIALLIFFFWRQGAFNILSQVHGLSPIRSPRGRKAHIE